MMRSVGVVAVIAAGSLSGLAAQYRTPRVDVVFPGKAVVRAEVARTEAERQRGLMHRRYLAPTEGMIFVFEEPGHYPFWMKNTLIALDLFWLDRTGRVVSIAESLPPCGNKTEADFCPDYPPSATDALYVVETAAGFAKKHGVKVGDRVDISRVEATKAVGAKR